MKILISAFSGVSKVALTDVSLEDEGVKVVDLRLDSDKSQKRLINMLCKETHSEILVYTSLSDDKIISLGYGLKGE